MRVSLVAIQVFLVGHFKGKSTLYKSTGWRLTFFSVPIRLSLWRTGKMNQHWRNLFAWVASCCSILTLHRGKRQSTILLPFKKSETDFNSQFRDFEVQCQNRIFPLKLFLRFFFFFCRKHFAQDSYCIGTYISLFLSEAKPDIIRLRPDWWTENHDLRSTHVLF